MRVGALLFIAAVVPVFVFGQATNIPWSGYAHDAQHTAVSATASQALNNKHWNTPVDLFPQLSGGELLIHYGSLSVTAANTVLVPVKTNNPTISTTPTYEILAFNGATGASVYTLNTGYTPPSNYHWVPSYGPTLSLGTRLYYPDAGGSVSYRDSLNAATGNTGQFVFYGKAFYLAHEAALNAAIQISTPITADKSGNIYFGFIAASGNGAGPAGADIVSGIAKVGPSGTGIWASATSLAGNDSSITQVPLNCAPALSNDQKTLYVAVSGSNDLTSGYIVSLAASNFAPIAHTPLLDPASSNPATISNDSSAAPMVGPDGDVYYGVLESNCCSGHNDRGWMLHFSSTLSPAGKTPGSFGWDNTASVVPASIVPSYHGTSSYLLLTKYNNYAGIGSGDGVNKVAVVDPNATMTDEYCSTNCPVSVMKEVITVTTSVGNNPSSEWCINTTTIDPFTKSAIINSENGNVYRWDFTTNSLLQTLNLTTGIGESYTPTIIGPDGTVYAINDAVLWAVGN